MLNLADESQKLASCVRAFQAEFDYVFRTIRRLGVPNPEAEDLTQEVFLIMWRRWSDFDATRPLRPWLLGIASNLALRYFERSRREQPRAHIDLTDETPPPDDRLAGEQSRQMVLQVLADLPERHRTALLLHEMEELSMRDLAAHWAVPLFTAYTRVRVAKQAFAQAVKEQQRNAGGLAGRSPPSPRTLLAFERARPGPSLETRTAAQARVRARLFLPPLFPSQTGTPPLTAPTTEWATTRATSHGSGRLFKATVSGATLVAATACWFLFAKAKAPSSLGPLDPLSTAARADTPLVASSTSAPFPARYRAAWTAPHAIPHLVNARASSSKAAGLGHKLMGHWRFDDPAGSGVAYDSSGSGRSCVLVGIDPATSWTDGSQDGALALAWPGRLTCPQPPIAAEDVVEMTIAVWVRRPQVEPLHRAIVTRQMGDRSNDYFFLGFAAEKVLLRSPSWHAKIVAPSPGVPGQWFHLAFTHDRTGVTRLFVNGTEVGQSKGQTKPVLVDGPLVVGAGTERGRTDVGRQFFRGAVDDLVVFERALTIAEISQLAAGVHPSP